MQLRKELMNRKADLRKLHRKQHREREREDGKYDRLR